MAPLTFYENFSIPQQRYQLGVVKQIRKQFEEIKKSCTPQIYSAPELLATTTNVKQMALMYDTKISQCVGLKPYKTTSRESTKLKNTEIEDEIKASHNTGQLFMGMGEDDFSSLTVKQKVQLFMQFISELTKGKSNFGKHTQLMEKELRGQQLSVKDLLKQLEGKSVYPRLTVAALVTKNFNAAKQECENMLRKNAELSCYTTTLSVNLKPPTTNNNIQVKPQRKCRSLPGLQAELKDLQHIPDNFKRNVDEMKFTLSKEAYAPPRKIRRTGTEGLPPKIFFQNQQLKNLFFTWLREQQEEPTKEAEEKTIKQFNKKRPKLEIVTESCMETPSALEEIESGLSPLPKTTSDESPADADGETYEKKTEITSTSKEIKTARAVRKKKLRRIITAYEEYQSISDSDMDYKKSETKISRDQQFNKNTGWLLKPEEPTKLQGNNPSCLKDSFVDQGFETGSNITSSPLRSLQTFNITNQQTEKSQKTIENLKENQFYNSTPIKQHSPANLNFNKSSPFYQQQLLAFSPIPTTPESPLAYKKRQPPLSNAVNIKPPAYKSSQFWLKCGDLAVYLQIFYSDSKRLRLLYDVFSQESNVIQNQNFGIDNQKFFPINFYNQEIFIKHLTPSSQYSYYWFSNSEFVIPFYGKPLSVDKVQRLFRLIQTAVEESKELRFGVDEVEFSKACEFWDNSSQPTNSLDSNYSPMLGLQSDDSNGQRRGNKFATTTNKDKKQLKLELLPTTPSSPPPPSSSSSSSPPPPPLPSPSPLPSPPPPPSSSSPPPPPSSSSPPSPPPPPPPSSSSLPPPPPPPPPSSPSPPPSSPPPSSSLSSSSPPPPPPPPLPSPSPPPTPSSSSPPPPPSPSPSPRESNKALFNSASLDQNSQTRSLDNLFCNLQKAKSEPGKDAKSVTVSDILKILKNHKERLSLLREKLSTNHLPSATAVNNDFGEAPPSIDASQLKSILTEISKKSLSEFKTCSLEELERYMFFLHRYAEVCLYKCCEDLENLLSALHLKLQQGKSAIS